VLRAHLTGTPSSTRFDLRARRNAARILALPVAGVRARGLLFNREG